MSKGQAYEKKFNRVFDYIERHLDEELGLARLSQLVHFSKFHFHRQFSSYAGFRFDICGEIGEDVPANAWGVVNREIPGGRCAVLRHFGAHERLGESIRSLYRDWLPDSGEELRDFPLFFHYLNLLPQTQEQDLITDIHLPLK